MIAMDMYDHDLVGAAEATSVAFALYLRPSELMRVRGEDIVVPPAGAPESQRLMSLILHPIERGQRSKTGVYDESLVLDNPQFSFVSAILRRWKSVAGPRGLACPLGYSKWSRSRGANGRYDRAGPDG